MLVLSPQLISPSVRLEPEETSISTRPRRLFAEASRWNASRRLTREPDKELSNPTEIRADENGASEIRAAAESRLAKEPDEELSNKTTEIRAAEIHANAEIRAAEIHANAEIHAKAEIRANAKIRASQAAPFTTVPVTVPVTKATVVSLPSTTVTPVSTVGSLPSTSMTPASLELPSVSATTSSSWTLMLSTRYHDALQNFSSEVQQSIYEDTDRLANGGPINRKIINFMEYLIDKLSGGGGEDGVPSGNRRGPPGDPPDKGGNSNSSSLSSSSVNSSTTSKKTRKDMSGVEALLQVIASQGAGGKNKENQFSEYEDKMIINSKHDALLDIPKIITLGSLSEWRYSYTSVF